MGCCVVKRRRQDGQVGPAELTEREAANTEGGKDEPSGQAKKLEITGGEVYLPYPNKPGVAVDFGVRLDEVGDKLVLSETSETSLAHHVDIQDGDVLVDINGTNIEGRQVQYLLDLLREEVNPKLLLTVKRKSGEASHVFVWTYFEVVVDEEDDQPTVQSLYVTQTDDDVMPWIDPGPGQAGAGYTWIGPPVSSYDIYLDLDTPVFLGIEGEQVELIMYYTRASCAFFRYLYVGPGRPSDGVPVVYSLQPYEKGKPGKPLANSTPVCGPYPSIGVQNLPSSMWGKNVPLNDLFWYQKASREGSFSLQSIAHEGNYVSYSGYATTLSKMPTYFGISLRQFSSNEGKP